MTDKRGERHFKGEPKYDYFVSIGTWIETKCGCGVVFAYKRGFKRKRVTCSLECNEEMKRVGKKKWQNKKAKTR